MHRKNNILHNTLNDRGTYTALKWKYNDEVHETIKKRYQTVLSVTEFSFYTSHAELKHTRIQH